MSSKVCYLCGKETHSLQKLFHKCQHQSACFNCLRSKYVKNVQGKDTDSAHFVVTKYPLECFHPKCRQILRNTQMERFCINDDEMKQYFVAARFAKILQTKLGKEWKELYSISAALGCDLCRCPQCKMIITKNGGCDHMTCLCGAEFSWKKNSACSLQDFEEDNRFQVAETIPNKTSQKKIRPSINTRDDHVFYQDCSFFEENEFHISEDSCDNESDHQEENPSLHSKDGSLIDDTPPTHSAEENCAEDSLAWSFLEEEQEASEEGSSLSLCAVSHPDTTELEDEALLEPSSNHTWEEVSDIASVVSLDASCVQPTVTMSFADAAKRGKSCCHETAPASPSRQRPPVYRPGSSNKSCVNQSDISDEFDADFILEGAKGARGGKEKFLYNRQRKKKYTRYSKYMRSNYSGWY